MEKKALVAVLDEMGTLLELQGANPFKSRAFHNASRTIDGITQDIGALVRSGEILEVDGIGKTIAGVISDLVERGKSKDYDQLRKSIPSGVLEMLRIQGLGPKKVKLLYEKLKIKSIDDLEKMAKSEKVKNLDGFGEKSAENILRGISALRRISAKSLYPKAAAAAQKVFAPLVKQREIIRAEIAGSLRRRKEIIGDIDIVVSAKDVHCLKLMNLFVSDPSVATIVAKGETKSSVVLSDGINCDLRIVRDEEFPFALNYLTGSKEHNVEMRSRARKYGWTLNEYGFSELGASEKRGKAKRIKPARRSAAFRHPGVKCKDESDIYKALDLEYVEPELRENMGEVEAAERGDLPKLLEINDICGTFHCHTTYSDGVNTLEEMASAARKLGWEYIGIADHSKAVAYARGMTEERVKQQHAEIDALNRQSGGFRILKGTECDILANGDLDWPDKTLERFDHVIAAIHSGFNLSEAEMTKRIIKALKNKYVTMLGHPTGRLLLSRDGYPVDMIQVINAASDYGKSIEINAHPLRLDLDWRLCKYAKEKGVMVAINPDAHNVEGLNDISYGVDIARKGWLEKRNVLNTFGMNGVLEYFQRS